MSTNSAACRLAAFIIGSLIALALPSAASATSVDILGSPLTDLVGRFKGVLHAGGPSGTDVTMNAPVMLTAVPMLNGGELVALNPGYASGRVILDAARVVLEPASSMTIILGFGAIGWASCRRRAVGRAVA